LGKYFSYPLGWCLFFFASGLFWGWSISFFSFWIWAEVCFLCMLLVLLFRINSVSVAVFFAFELGFSSWLLLWGFLGWERLGILVVVGKLGLFPFWLWVIQIFKEAPLSICFLVITFYKILVVLFMVYFWFGYGILVWLMINFFSWGLLLFVGFEFKFVLCFCSIFSTGWLLLFGEVEIIFFYFIFYFLMFGFLLLVGHGSFAYEFGLGMWLFFYLGFPFLLPFFVKLVGLVDVVSWSFSLGVVVFIRRASFLLFVFLGWGFSFVRRGFLILRVLSLRRVLL